MKNILIEYNVNNDDISFSQAIKVAALNFKETNFNVLGDPNFTTIFTDYLDNIKELDNNSNKLEELETNNDGIILEASTGYEFNNGFHFCKSFNKKFALFVTNDTNISLFLKLNESLKTKFNIFNDDILNKDDYENDLYFNGYINVEDLLSNDSTLILCSKQYFDNFIKFLNCFSNYFLNRFQANQNKSFFAKFNKSFKNVPEEKPKTLYTDIVYPFTVHINDERLYLILKKDTDVNEKIKALSVFSSLINNKFDLINK